MTALIINFQDATTSLDLTFDDSVEEFVISFDDAGGAAAAAAIAAHKAEADPHPIYQTQSEGDSRYWQLSTDLATQAELDAHLNDTTAAHNASAIASTPFGTVAATDVQAALQEVFNEATGTGGTAAWGGITGTLSNQTDLAAALAGKEPTITTGTTSQFWRGDKSFATITSNLITQSTNNKFVTDAQLANIANLSGVNTGDQTITLTGHVSGSGTGSFATTIANGVISLAMFANIATSRILGRITAGAGGVEELTATQAKTILAIASSDVSGLGTLATLNSVDLSGGQATGILAAGRFPALTGDVTTSAGNLATTIANNAVTLGKFQQIATASFLGRTTAGTGNTEVLTTAQATALLDLATSTLKGLVPASGGGTTNFLRSDLTWAAPPGGGGGSFAATTVNIAFTDGDTVRRVTITDAGITSTSKIIGTVIRPNILDENDIGYVYHVNVVSRSAGSFDIIIACTLLGGELADSNPPNETVSYCYAYS